MNKTLRKALRIAPVILVLALLLYVLPFWAVAAPILVYVVLGVIDVSRNDLGGEAPVIKRYFAGNGILTWLLSPFNLFMDLLSKRTPGVLQVADLPPDMQREINGLLDVVKREKDTFIERIEAKRANSERVMLMFQWYGRNVDTSIPELNRDFKYVKTVGISVFAPNARTKFHYGPLRVTYRLLYNLTPVERDDVYIEVGKTKNIWRDNPCFIFDDTLMHRSVNDSDEARYCLFADFMRPSAVHGLTTKILDALGVLLKAVNRLFYKNWDFI